MKYSYLLLIFLMACKNQGTEKTVTPPTIEEKKQVAIDPKKSGLPPVTLDIMKKMIAEVDYIDYIMYDLPFSISQDTKNDINSNIMFIANTPAGDVPNSCKPIGRKFYNIKGETFMTADIYFSNGCAFYIFLEGETPKYSATFTKEGYNFYTQIIAQGEKVKSGSIPQQ